MKQGATLDELRKVSRRLARRETSNSRIRSKRDEMIVELSKQKDGPRQVEIARAAGVESSYVRQVLAG